MSSSDAKLEKYRDLYVLSKEVLAEEQQRFHRIDEKASRYLSVLTFVVGADAFFGNWILENLVPPDSGWEWLLVVLGVLLFLSTVVSWLSVFSILKVHALTKIPLDAETISFFKDNRLEYIYYALARGNESALRKNRDVTDNKSARLYRAYNIILFTISLLVIFLLVYGGHEWLSGQSDCK